MLYLHTSHGFPWNQLHIFLCVCSTGKTQSSKLTIVSQMFAPWEDLKPSERRISLFHGKVAIKGQVIKSESGV